MHWTEMRSVGMAIGAIVTALTAGAPAVAEVIVVRASGPSASSYPAGRKLADRGTVALKAGDMLILLDGQGTRTLRGPGTFGTNAAPNAGSDTRNTLDALVAPRTASRARTGAVRGSGTVGVAARSPNLWYVDTAKSTIACIADPANVVLWRPDATAAATLTATATGAKGGKSATIAFDAGRSIAAWPSDILPVTEGATYRLSWTGGNASPTQIGFALMAAQSEGLEGMAASLIARKCEAQLALLVDTVALPDPAPIAPGG